MMRGIERRPLAVQDHGARREAMLLHRLFRGEDHPRGAVGDLRAVAGSDLAPRALEGRLELRELLDRAVRAHAVVVIDRPCRRAQSRLELALEPAFLLRAARAAAGFRPRIRSASVRVMSKRWARISAVCPMLRSTIGSVSPRSSPMTGLQERRAKAERAPRARDQAIARAEQTRVPIDRRCGETAAARGSALRRRPPG